MPRHSGFFYLLPFALSVLSSVQAMPVFLKPDSLFASGQYPQAQLEKRTSDVQMQIRTRVRSGSGRWGWCAEEQLITPLKLSRYALLKKDTPVLLRPVAESTVHETWPSGVSVQIMEFHGSWFLIQRGPKSGWVLSESLTPDLRSASRAFVKTSLILHATHFARSQELTPLPQGTWVDVVQTDQSFARVRTLGFEGEIARRDLVMRDDLKANEAVSVYPQLPLHSAATPDSDITARAALFEKLTVHESRKIKWGLVRNTETGPMWWPIDSDFVGLASSAPSQPMASFLTADLFSRKIFDMAASPALPNLKFVSAAGIFRTMDGITWQKLSPFKDENYPIAVAPHGAVFIGPYKSTDQGETFESFLRLDRLSSALRERWKTSPSRLKILAIQTLDPEGEKLDLSLDVGFEHPVHVQTSDQGVSWRAL